MPAGADFGFPAFLAHGDAAADDFVDVGHGEGDMVDAGFAGAVENEKIVVLANAFGSA